MNKIGVFDSGIGGLSVLASLKDSHIFSEIIYYGDTARVPYGVRDRETILRFSMEAMDFFSQFSLDMLIVACNTISAVALESMQKVAHYPIIGVIESGVLSLSNKLKDKNKQILIIATRATIESGLYESKLNSLGYHNTQSIQTGLFVPLVEEGLWSGEVLDSVMEYYFKDIETPDGIILGCTHFPLIANEIAKYFDNKPILIHSGEAIVEFLKNTHKLESNKSDEPKISYFASSNLQALEKNAKIWLNQASKIKQI